MAREKYEDSQDVKTGSVIKYKNGKLVMDKKYALQVWEDYFKELLNQRENSEHELPSSVEGEVGRDRGCRSRDRNIEDKERPSDSYP